MIAGEVQTSMWRAKMDVEIHCQWAPCKVACSVGSRWKWYTIQAISRVGWMGGTRMHYIVVTGFDRPIRLFMSRSPAVAAIKILHDYGLGKIREITEKIGHLPAEFGPISPLRSGGTGQATA
jgi:hypothetical protein